MYIKDGYKITCRGMLYTLSANAKFFHEFNSTRIRSESDELKVTQLTAKANCLITLSQHLRHPALHEHQSSTDIRKGSRFQERYDGGADTCASDTRTLTWRQH